MLIRLPSKSAAVTVVEVPSSSGSWSTSSASRSWVRWIAPASASWVSSGAGRVEAAEDLHGRAAGDVASGRAADAVGDDEEVLAGEAGVLVVLAHAADVGQRCVAQRQGATVRVVSVISAAAYLRSSSVVLPMRTWVPSWRVVGWVSREEPM